jgi:hypothetical protein
MDYPAPLVQDQGRPLDLSDAYGRGIGAFDAFTIRYGYSQFAPALNEDGPDRDRARRRAGRDVVRVRRALARSRHAAPLGAVWDNGADPIESLRHEIEVRRIALDHFGLADLRPGQPLSELEPLLLPSTSITAISSRPR